MTQEPSEKGGGPMTADELFRYHDMLGTLKERGLCSDAYYRHERRRILDEFMGASPSSPGRTE